MNLVSTLGIDLAKSTFSLHGVNAKGEVVLRRSLSRAKLSELVAQLQPCLIGMEACSGAHEWARRFSASGHTVKLMQKGGFASTLLGAQVQQTTRQDGTGGVQRHIISRAIACSSGG
jgi:hypothetical protein